MASVTQAQSQVRQRVHRAQQEKQRQVFQAEFARLVRTAYFQLNVQHQWPHTVTLRAPR